MSNSIKPRIGYLDIAKGILIVFMVYGHVFLSGPLRQYIYSFHMPAFFCVSGILLHYSSSLSKSFFSVVKSKVLALLVPLAFFELFGILTDILRFGFTLNLFGYAYNTLSLDLNNGPCWFLWALFVDEILFIGILKLTKNNWTAMTCLAAAGMLILFCRRYIPLAESTVSGLFFMAVGYFAHQLFTEKQKIPFVLMTAFLSVVSCFLNNKIDEGVFTYGNSLILYAVSAVLGTALLMQMCMRFQSGFLAYFGRNTLAILGTHNLLILPVRTYLNVSADPNAAGFLLLGATLVFTYVLSLLLNRLVPVLIGKKKPQTVMEHIICIPGYIFIPAVIAVQILIRIGFFS